MCSAGLFLPADSLQFILVRDPLFLEPGTHLLSRSLDQGLARTALDKIGRGIHAQLLEDDHIQTRARRPSE